MHFAILRLEKSRLLKSPKIKHRLPEVFRTMEVDRYSFIRVRPAQCCFFLSSFLFCLNFRAFCYLLDKSEQVRIVECDDRFRLLYMSIQTGKLCTHLVYNYPMNEKRETSCLAFAALHALFH